MPVWDVKYIALVESETCTAVVVLSSGPDLAEVKQHISWGAGFVKLHKIKVLERPEEVAEWNAELRASNPDAPSAADLYPDNPNRALSERKAE